MKNAKAVMYALVFILLLGFLFRFTGITRDGIHNFHPDESLLAEGVGRIRFFREMNPGIYDYNGLPMYAVRAARWLFAAPGGNLIPAGLPGIILSGRIVSAVLSGITVLLTYFLAKSLLGTVWALLPAILFAVYPLSVQQAHFFTTDTYLALFLVLLLLFMDAWNRKKKTVLMLLCGLVTGWGIASKTTFILASAAPLALIAFSGIPGRKKILTLFAYLLSVAVFFGLGTPYSVLAFPSFLERTRYLADMASGRSQFVWTTQFAGTGPLFLLRNILYGSGPFTAIAGLSGFVILLRDSVMKKNRFRVIMTAWAFLFLVFLSLQYVKFIRYILPVLPILAIGAGYFVMKVSGLKNRAVVAIVFAAASVDLLWGAAFLTIYSGQHPKLTLSTYMAGTMPRRVRVLYENTNCLCQPVGVGDFSVIPTNFDFYSPDTPKKRTELAEALAGHDYMVMPSDIVMRTITRLDKRYPISSLFYRLLFSGKLGYRLVWEHAQYPALGPLVIPDTGSEETFRVFDHPHPYVFKNIKTMTRKDYEAALSAI